MEQILEALRTPAGAVAMLSVGVALLSFILQGINAIINIVIHVRDRGVSVSQQRIEYLTALFLFVDGLPIDDGRKTVLKSQLLRQASAAQLPIELSQVLDELL